MSSHTELHTSNGPVPGRQGKLHTSDPNGKEACPNLVSMFNGIDWSMVHLGQEGKRHMREETECKIHELRLSKETQEEERKNDQHRIGDQPYPPTAVVSPYCVHSTDKSYPTTSLIFCSLSR